MEKFSINKDIASKIWRSLNATVSAGNSVPDQVDGWYTILPIGISRVCMMKRDLEDMENLSKMHGDIKVGMHTNPIGTLIFPSQILTNFDFTMLTPGDAKIICNMIRKNPTEIKGKNYLPMKEPLLTYSLREVNRVTSFVRDVKAAEKSDNDTVIETSSPSIEEYVAMTLFNNKENNQ